MSVPYTVQSGETFQDIATKLGIKDWTKLKEYHTQQTGQQVPSIPYAGLTLMTPTQEEIYEMNGETPPPDPAEEQKNAEQKQGEEKKKEEDKKKEEKASKSEHDGKYFVVHNAKCVCNKAENPKQTADLQVTTHKIIVLNDDQSKLAATEADKSFIPPVATFGKCTLKPTAGGYLPCALAPADKWSKTYESTQVMGKNTLTEISELQCTVGGKITIDKHGQTDSVSNAHADNTNPLELSMVNPAIEQPKKKEEYPVVTSISMTGIENRENFKEIDSKNKKEITYLRKDEEISFKANLKSGNKQLTSWMVYSDHQGKKENRLFLREQIGTEFSQSFANTGTFRIEGYGKPKDPDFEKGKYDKCDPSCSLDVEVVENTLQDIECTSGDFSTRIDPSKNRKFRRGVPSVFKAKFFIPNLTEDEKSRLTMTLTDGDGNVLTEGVQTGETLTFTPKNTKAKYTVIARYTNDNGDIIEKKISGESEGNAVLGISHGAEAIRPGTPMSFSVSKMKYNIGTNNPYDVTPDESSEIKWNLNGIFKGNGKSITLPGTEFTNPGKYIVEAYSNVANAHGKSSKDEEDDWRFEVKYNTVTEIKAGKKARTGSEVPFEIGKTALNGYDATKDGPITWKITGPASGTGTGEKFNYKFLLPGEYTIDCLMGGRSSQNPLKIKVVQPKILVDTSKWIDNDGSSGNVIKEAGYGQEVCAFVKYEGIQGEEVTLQIYDNDSNGINLVHNITGTLPENTGGVYWPFTLDNSIKLKIEAKGLTKDGKLHFKLVPKDAALKIVNGEKSLGEYLKVSNVPKIVDAYFCDAADTEKLYNSPIDKALYLKVYAINMVDKKVEVHFMTKSDIYFDVAWNPKQWKDWKDVKEKFSKETFFYKTDGTINKKGELIVKVDPSKLGKPKNYFKISAVIKITDGEGKDAKEKAAYLDHSEMAILYATATLPNMAENKGAVKVGREALSTPKEKEKLIIFPLLVKPENDDKNKWVKDYYWAAKQRDNMATFNANRAGNRRHAARDLYTKPLETVVAIADGEVLEIKSFYDRTDQVTIRHKLKDGRDFIIRYGELDPESITVKKGDKVTQKKEIGKTGKLMKTDTEVRLKIGGVTVYMLHFEHFTEGTNFNIQKDPLSNNTKPFMRRADLVDSLAILEEGYRNTFGDGTSGEKGNRVSPSTLTTSQKGKDFIKDWEKYYKMPYDDSEDYATIGYGYLIAYKSYKNLTQAEVEKTDITWKEFQEGISEARALELFNAKVKKYENAVKRDIKVNLYQQEFDALVSLLFNTGSEFLNTGGAKGGETKIKQNINNQMYEQGADEMSDVTNNGTSGLVKRRKAEINMFKNNIYDSTH